MNFIEDKSVKLLLALSLLGTSLVVPMSFNTPTYTIIANASKNKLPNEEEADPSGNAHGHIVLQKNYVARNTSNANTPTKVPKGTAVNYKLESNGIEIWNKKLPQKDGYEIFNGDLANSLKHHKKQPSQNNKNDITEINAKNKKKRQQRNKNNIKLRQHQSKQSLPRTSDYTFINNTGYIILGSLALILTYSLVKSFRSNKKDN